MHTPRSLWLVAVSVVITQTPFALGCSSEDAAGPAAALVASWNATSFTAQGQDYIAQGMTLSITFTNAGTYTIVFMNDLIGACDPDPDCTATGDYTATATQLTIDPGTMDEVTFNYTIQGSAMTFTGTIDGIPTTIAFTRV